MTMTRLIKFGYELEFCAIPRSSTETREQASHRYAQAITEATGIYVKSETYSHNAVTSDFKIVTDGSVGCCRSNNCRCDRVHGLELVSRPYTDLNQFTSHLRQIKKVMSKLLFSVNDTCGLHIHHDIATNALEKEDIIKLNRYYSQSDHLITSFIGKKRLHNGFCKPYTYTERIFDDSKDVKILEKYEESIRSEDIYTPHSRICNPDSNQRYRNVNVTAKNRHRTIEFRAMQSTLDIDDTVRWIEFTNALMYKAKSFKVLDTFARRELNRDNVESMFKKLQLSFDDYKEFYI